MARQLHVHRDVVSRVMAEHCASVPTAHRPPTPLQASRVDPYRHSILAALEKFSTLTAARLRAMMVERGWVGGAAQPCAEGRRPSGHQVPRIGNVVLHRG